MSGLHYTIKATDGTVYTGVLGRDVKKTVDRRSDQAPVETVFEVRTPGGLIVKLWPEQVAEIEATVEP